MNDDKRILTEIAKKICTNHCIASFECGKTKAAAGNLPLCGTNTVCPLQEYDVQHSNSMRLEKKDILSWWQNEPTLDELDTLCQYCTHRDKSNDTDTTFSTESCFVTHCIDCPVQMYRENIEEATAEAMMS